MREGKVFACVLLLVACVGCAGSGVDRRDPQIAEMMVEVDPDQIKANIEKLVSFKTRHTLSDTQSQTEGIGAARRWIKSEFDHYAIESGGRLQVEMFETTVEKQERVPRTTSIVNVIATLPGTEHGLKDRVYIVSGHYDSRALDVNDNTSEAPGANDDASGTAAVMEMARVMSKRNFPATIMFLCVAGEEQGLLGSAAIAQRAKEQGWNVAGMLDNDIIGNTIGGNGVHDDTRVRLFSEGIPTNETPVQLQTRQSIGGENDGPSRQLARYIKEVGEQYVKNFHVTMVYRRDRFGRGGDHIPFLRHGIPAVRFTEPNEDFSRQHQDVTIRNGRPYGDVLAYVDFNYIAQVTRVNLAAIGSLASAPSPPKGVVIEPDPSYNTVLRWEKSDDPNVAGYAVRVRETTSATWSEYLDVGSSLHATIKGINKDDYIFGVESYDAQGHRSVAVIPQPRRANASATAPSK